METTKDDAFFAQKRTALRDKALRLEAALGQGPFFAENAFSIVDAVFAPVFRYFDVFDQITDLGTFAGLPKLAAWRNALAARPSVIGAVRPDYPDLLDAFMRRHDGALLRHQKKRPSFRSAKSNREVRRNESTLIVASRRQIMLCVYANKSSSPAKSAILICKCCMAA